MKGQALPQKASAKRRALTRDRVRRWRDRHRCLTTVEIEARVRELGGLSRPPPKGRGVSVETVPLSDFRVERYVYQSWLREAS